MNGFMGALFNKLNIKKKKSIPGIISKTLDALWVLLLSVMGREIMFIHIDIHANWDYNAILKIVVLAFCLVFYAVYYYRFQKYYKIAEEKDKENFKRVNDNLDIERKRINYFLWNRIKLRFLFWFLIPSILLILYLYIRSQA